MIAMQPAADSPHWPGNLTDDEFRAQVYDVLRVGREVEFDAALAAMGDLVQLGAASLFPTELVTSVTDQLTTQTSSAVNEIEYACAS